MLLSADLSICGFQYEIGAWCDHPVRIQPHATYHQTTLTPTARGGHHSKRQQNNPRQVHAAPRITHPLFLMHALPCISFRPFCNMNLCKCSVSLGLRTNAASPESKIETTMPLNTSLTRRWSILLYQKLRKMNQAMDAALVRL